MAMTGASGNGKKASLAMALPWIGRSFSPALDVAMRTESTRLIWPAPIPTVAPSFANTIALLFTCFATFQANTRSVHSCSVGARSVTTLIVSRSSLTSSASCTSTPPSTRRYTGSPGLPGRTCSPVSSSRTLGLRVSTSKASSS